MIGKELEAAIGDAPEHIAGLRKLAVAFAIGGRLDAPSTAAPEELLAQIDAARSKLERAGKVKKRKGGLTVQPEHLPEAFDDVSRFVPLAKIASIEKGKTGIKQAVAGEFPLVVTAAARETCDHFDFDAAAAIIPLVSSTGHGNASINRLHYQEGKFALGTILAAVVPHDPDAISARFLFEYLSAFKDELLVSRMTGTANVTLTIGRIGEVPVPLLSAEAQSKLDELMALCDRLEEARQTREEVRDKLTSASLARLTAPDTTAEDFPTHAAFALEALPALTTRPDQIKTLRQTILNLAVCGKLVEQDAADEPVLDSLLGLEEVPAKTRKLLRPLNSAESASDLPQSWVWLPLGAIIRGMDAGWSPQCENHPRSNNDEWGVLKTTAVQALAFDPMQHKLLPSKLKPRPEYQAEVGDILVTRAGPKNRVGVSCVVDVPCPKLMISDKLIRFHALGDLSPRYVALTLNAGITFERIEAAKSGMAVMQMNVSQVKLKAIPVPLPPLAEQHRIVAKVDALMALCDRLEAALTTADTARAHLLEALLHDALDPVTETLEAAE